MGEPVSTAAVFAFLNSCFKFAEYAVKLYGVESENGIFVHLIQQVQLDLEETERLLAVPAVTKKLKSTPEKWRWIRESITRTKASVNEIGKWVEPVRGEQVAYGSVSFRTKVKWIFNDHDKLVTRSAQLRAAHQTLSNVLVFLTPLEDPTSQEPESLPTYDDAISLDPLLSRQQRRQKELYLDSLQRGEKISAEGFSNEAITTQRSIHQSSSMVNLTQSTATFNLFPTSTTQHTSSHRPGLDKEHADENELNSFHTMPSGRPPSEYHMGIDVKPVASLFSSSALELPRPASSSVAPKRTTESFGRHQLPFLSTSARETSEEVLPSQPPGPVSRFHPWFDTAAFQATASPEEVVEMTGEFPRRPLSAAPRDPSASRTEQNSRIQEHARTLESQNLKSTDPCEMLADLSTRDFSIVNIKPPVPPKIAIDQPAEEVYDEPPSRPKEISSRTILQPHKQTSSSAQAQSSHSPLKYSNSSTYSTLASGSNTPDAAKIKRKPTQKWLNARRVNYDNTDYGDGVDGYHDPTAVQVGEDDEPEDLSQSQPIPQMSYQNHNQNQQQQQPLQPEPSHRYWVKEDYAPLKIPEPQPGPSTHPHRTQLEAEYQIYSFPELRPDPLNLQHLPLHNPSIPRHLPPTIDITSPTPEFTPQQHYRSFSFPEVVTPQPLGSIQPETSTAFDGYEAPLGRSATVSETRRLNMNARLAMMRRESERSRR